MRIAVLVALLCAIGAAAILTLGRTAHRRVSDRASASPTIVYVPATAVPLGRSPSTPLPHPPHSEPAIAATLRYTPFVARGLPRRRVIALTFDDGPSPYTPQVVRILARMHAPATFFIVGQQLNYFSAGLRATLAHGFVIGDHTTNHAWLTRLSRAAQDAQIRGAAARAERLGAPKMHLFRPPYGAFNARTLAVVRAMRMLMVLWSIDTGDWHRPGVGSIVKRALAGAAGGAIVLLHDGGGDRSQTVAALPDIINGLRRRGFRLVSVPELLRLDPPPRHQQFPRGLSGI